MKIEFELLFEQKLKEIFNEDKKKSILNSIFTKLDEEIKFLNNFENILLNDKIFESVSFECSVQ